MADKIDRERAKDSSIKTDDLNLGTIDDINLDFPGDGDEGIEFGKGRKPSNPKKDFAIEFAKGIGGGVKSAGVSELKKVLPEGAAIVSELGATFDDIKSLKEDLSKQLGPMATTMENATRKLLPSVEKFLPKKVYEKAKKKLDERAEARKGYSAPSKEQMEQEQIASELSGLFAAQAETTMTEMRDRKNDAMVDRAMGSVRHRQQVQHLTHLYDSMRSTELFHKTQHMAYMKKSLELKYKHVFIARDTFNLLQQSMKTYEGYLKSILANTALPDMAKVKIGDYHRKSRTEKYGNMMSEALTNIRGKIMDKIKDSAKNLMGSLGMATDMVGMGADMSEMGGGFGKMVPGLLGKAAGFFGGSPIAKKLLGKFAPLMNERGTGLLNTSLGGMKANAAVKLSEMREKWAQSDNFFKNMLADFMPDTFAQSDSASNDLLTKSKDAATFDVITRQSITEVIPGYLGKIWHEIAMMRTGDENIEEQTFNVYERRFTGVSTLKKDLFDKAFGDEKLRRGQLNKTLALMQAGVARNRPDKDANDAFKGYEKDINRFCLNHAQYGVVFKPNELRGYLVNDPGVNTSYIEKVCRGFENSPALVIEAICSALFNEDGEIDMQASSDLQTAITENFRKMDQYKTALAEANETFGLKQHLVSKMDGQEEKRLKEIIDVGGTAKSRIDRVEDPEQKAKLEAQIQAAEEAQKRMSADSGIFSSIGEVNKMNLDEMLRERANIKYDEVDANQEDWIRRRAYDKYQKFDEGVDFMRDHGVKMGSRVANAVGARAHVKMRDYNEVFNVDESLRDSGKPEAKKGYKGDLKTTLDKMRGDIVEKFTGKRPTGEFWKDAAASVKGAASMASEAVSKTIEKLSPESKKQIDKAKAKIAELKKQFEGTEAGKKVAEQLSNLERVYDSVVKSGEDGVQWLKDEGAFDDPTGFLKKVYGKSVDSVKTFTDTLPPISDTEGWKDLLSKKADEAKSFASEKVDAFKKTDVGKKTMEVSEKISKSVAGAVDAAKKSEVGKKATSLYDRAVETGKKVWSDFKQKASEGLHEAGIDFGGAGTPPPAAGGGGSVPPVPPIGSGVTDNVIEPESVGSSEVVDRLDKILGVVSDWKTEATENQGTIFDAIAQTDEDVKSLKGTIGVGGGNLNEAELAKKLGEDMRKNSLLRKGLHAGKEAIAGTVKGVGKVYTKVYGAALKGAGQAIKGVGYAAGNAIKAGYKAAAGVGKWLTSKEDYVDIYVKGKEGGMPLVSARKQKDPDEGIFYKSSGKRVEHSRDIDEPCVDKRGQLVITEEDLKAGLVMNNSTPIGKIGAGALALAKGYFSVYGKALTAIGGVVKTVAKGLFGTGVERWQDVYRKDEVGKGPLVTARQQKEDGVYFFESGKKVEKSSDIHEPVCDRDKKILVSKEDVEHGLVDVNNKPLGSGGGGGALRALARGIGGALPGLGKFIGKAGSTMLDIYGKGYKGLMDLGIGALKGAGKFLGRALGLDLGGIGKMDEDLKKTIIDTNSVLHMMQLDLAAIAVKMHAKEMEGTAPTAAGAQPKGPTTGPTPTGASTAEDKTPKTEATTPSSEDAEAAPFDDLKNKIVGKAKDLGSSLKSRMMSFIRPKQVEAIVPAEKQLADGSKEIETPEGTEITVEPPLAPSTEVAIVGTQSILGSIETKLSDFFTKQENKNPLDKDGDGDIDGSYADQMQNKKDASGKRVDAADMHKDVNWLKDEKEEGGKGGKDGEDGGGIFDMLEKLVPKKWRRRIKALKKVYGKKVLAFAKGAGSWMLKGGRALMTGAAGLFSKALPFMKGAGSKMLGLGAKAMPWVAKAGGAAMHGLGAAGSAVGGLLGSAGSAISGGIASMGGLAGIGSTLLSLAGPAALAALAGYGIYRGVKGFSKKNTLENVGKSEGISKENQLTGEDRMYSALGLNSKIGAKTAKFASQALGIHGLIKGIRGNDNPLTDKEIEKGRTKLQRKIDKKMPGYDRILQEYEKAVEAGNWKRARELSGQEADGLIKSMWKNSIPGMVTKGLGNLIFGNKNEEMTKEEIEKTRAKFNSIIKKGGSAGKNAEKLLSKFEDYVSEQDWKNARKIAGAEKRGLFGKLFQDSKGNIKWGTVIGGVVGGIPGLIIGSLFNKADVNKPMTEEEVKKARERLQGLIKNGNKAAEKILDQFDEAVTEQNWKKARKLVGEEVQSNLKKFGGALKTAGKWYLRIGTLGLSTLFESDQDKPMTEMEIKKFTDKMNFLIDKHHDKLAKKKLEKFEEAVAAQKWDKARQIAKMPHKSLATRALKAYWNWTIGSDDEPMTEQEMQKFRDSMERKIKLGNNRAKKKLEAFEDAVGAQRWRRARTIAQSPNDGWMTKGAKGLGKMVANNFRFWFGGDGKPMSESEIEQTRREMGWAIQENKKGAQKRLDLFNDYVADEKWEKARKLAKMPYENVVKRASKAIGNFLFGNDKDALSPEEIDKFQKECEQRIADGVKGNWSKVLEQFNAAVEAENWAKARKISGMKAEGAVKKVAKALNPFNWFKDDYESCQKKKEELEEKAMDDETGLVNKGLEKFDVLVRRQQYSEAMKFADDLLKLKPAELAQKHGLKTDEYDQILKDGQALQIRIEKALKKEKPGLFPNMKILRLQSIKNELVKNQAQWGADYFEEIRDKLSSITGEDEYSDIDKVDDKVIQEGQTLLEDIKKSKERYSWFTSPLIRTKLANLESEIKGEMADWNEGSFTMWQERLKDIDKDYKTREEKKADEKRKDKIEDKAQKKAGEEVKSVDPKTGEIVKSKPTNPIAVDYYGDAVVKRKPWLGNVEDPGDPASELKAKMEWKDKLASAKKTAEDAYRWRGKGEGGTDAEANNRFGFKKGKEHQIIGNKIEGWQWDENDKDVVIKWKDGIATKINIKDLTDEELIEIANQSRNTGARRATDLDYDNELQNRARAELDKRGVNYEGKDDEKLKWMGKSVDNEPKKTTNHFKQELTASLGAGISIKAHQLVGNKLEGWEWDIKDSNALIRWKNFNKTVTTFKDLKTEELIELAHQKDEKAAKRGGFTAMAGNHIQDRAISELKARNVPEEWWDPKAGEDEKSETEEGKETKPTDTKPKAELKAGGGFWDNVKGHLVHWKNVAKDKVKAVDQKLDDVGLKGLGVKGTLKELKGRLTGSYSIDPEMERLMRLPKEEAIKELGSVEAYNKMADEYDRLRTSGYLGFKDRMLGNRFFAGGEYIDAEQRVVNDELVKDNIDVGFAPEVIDRRTREHIGEVDKYKFDISKLHNDELLLDNDVNSQHEAFRSGRRDTIDPTTGKLVTEKLTKGQRYDELADLMDRNRKRGWFERMGMKARGFFKDVGVRGIGGKLDKSGVPEQLQSLYDQAYEISTTNPKHAVQLVESLWVKWSAENKDWLKQSYPDQDTQQELHDCVIEIAKDPNKIKEIYKHIKGIVEKSIDKLKSAAKSGVERIKSSDFGANVKGLKTVIADGSRSDSTGIKTGFWRKLTNNEEATAELAKIAEMSPEEGIKYCGSEEAWRAAVGNYRQMRLNKRLGWWDRITGKNLQTDRLMSAKDTVSLNDKTGSNGSYGSNSVASRIGEDIKSQIYNANGKATVDSDLSFALSRVETGLRESYGDMKNGTKWETSDVYRRIRSNDVDNAADKFGGVGSDMDVYAQAGMSTRERMDAYDELMDANRKKKWYERGLEWAGAKLTGNKLQEKPEWRLDSKRNDEEHVALMAEAIQVGRSKDGKKISEFKKKVNDFLSTNIQNGIVDEKHIKPYIKEVQDSINAIIANPDDPGKIPHRDDYDAAMEKLRTAGYVTPVDAFKSNAEKEYLKEHKPSLGKYSDYILRSPIGQPKMDLLTPGRNTVTSVTADLTKLPSKPDQRINSKSAEVNKSDTIIADAMQNQSQQNAEMVKQMKQMSETNQKLAELLSSAFTKDGMKIQGMDTLTEVCATPSPVVDGGNNNQVQVVQAPAPSQFEGLDLRKRQM